MRDSLVNFIFLTKHTDVPALIQNVSKGDKKNVKNIPGCLGKQASKKGKAYDCSTCLINSCLAFGIPFRCAELAFGSEPKGLPARFT